VQKLALDVFYLQTKCGDPHFSCFMRYDCKHKNWKWVMWPWPYPFIGYMIAVAC